MYIFWYILFSQSTIRPQPLGVAKPFRERFDFQYRVIFASNLVFIAVSHNKFTFDMQPITLRNVCS